MRFAAKVAMGSAAVALSLGPVASAAAATTTGPAPSVIIVGMPGLRWQDVTARDMPYLSSLVGHSTVGQMTTRSARSRTCPADGWLQLGTGNRARYPIPDDAPDGSCQTLPDVQKNSSGGAEVEGWQDLVTDNKSLTFGAIPGLLGQTLQDAGMCSTAVEQGAALAASNVDGVVSHWLPESAEIDPAVLRRCPLTVVAGEEPRHDIETGVRRPDDLTRFDDLVAAIDKARPASSLMLVLGVSDLPDERAQLHLALAQGPGFTDGFLVSGSTRRPPFIQLSDIAPTVLDTLGLAIPTAMPYQPIQVSSTANSDRQGRLVDLGRQSRVTGQVTPAFFTLLVLAQGLLYLAAFLILRRHPTGDTRSRVLDFTQVVAVAAASAPAATYLANLLPWWQSTHPAIALLGAISLAGALLTLISFAGPWRRHPFGPAGVMAAATALVLAIDLLAGAPLQLSSVAGYSPVVAGRFVGFGNLAFAIFGTAALLATAAVVSGRSHRVTLAVVAVVGVFAVTLDGAPSLGADFGGVLALIPAFGTLGWMAIGRRLTWRPLAFFFGSAVVVVSIIATLDYLRPEQDQTHLGRFVQSALDGDAWEIVHRKIDANLSLLTSSVLTLMVPIAVLFVAFLMRRPQGLLPETFTAVPTLRAGLYSVLVLGIIGALVNDSGVAVPAMAATVAIPIAVAVVARVVRISDDRDQPPELARAALPVEPPA